MSLLGVLAYLAHTRLDILVFISALQRHTHKPQVIHIKRLNRLLSWVQRNPKKLAYKKLGSGNLRAEATNPHLKIISDAAYKKETEDGYSLRGAVYLRGEGHMAETNLGQSSIVHVLDWTCKSQRHVTRSTFAAELLSAGDAADQGVLIAQMLYELKHGVLSPTEARDKRTHGGYIPTALYLDAKSVYAAITASEVKVPAEKSLLTHILYLREMLDTHVMHYLVWLDTRDMVADGLTKGAVDRQALHQVMECSFKIHHEVAAWSSKTNKLQQQQGSYMIHGSIHAEVFLSLTCLSPCPYSSLSLAPLTHPPCSNLGSTLLPSSQGSLQPASSSSSPGTAAAMSGYSWWSSTRGYWWEQPGNYQQGRDEEEWPAVNAGATWRARQTMGPEGELQTPVGAAAPTPPWRTTTSGSSTAEAGRSTPYPQTGGRFQFREYAVDLDNRVG